MWTKLDDGLESHQKLRRAGLLIKRPAGFTRALGAFTLALLHANRYLTDGFVSTDVFDGAGVPEEDRSACVAARLLSFDDARKGYWIHDFHEWNPTAAEVKARQKRDRDRKRSRQGFRVDSEQESEQKPTGIHSDSNGTPRGIREESFGSSSRAVPVPSRPVQPPVVPLERGGRLTRTDRKVRSRLAEAGIVGDWREGCTARGHTGCANPSQCDLTTAIVAACPAGACARRPTCGLFAECSAFVAAEATRSAS